MLKLYKYMSQEVALKFIKNPVLRVTPNWALNDPFESKLAVSTSKHLNSLDANAERSKRLEDFMGLHGIVSLSETADNLLMWSHYADEHKGAVVELLIDERAPFKTFNITGCPASSDATFSKVNYRKRRNYPIGDTADPLESIKKHYYLTKSDEWIYEKEHRFIFPVTEISSAKLSPGEMNMYPSFKPESDDLTHIYSLSAEDKVNLWGSSQQKGSMFFAEIHPKSIGRILIGCNADLALYKESMIEAEESNPHRTFACSVLNKFQGVEISRLHDERFELFFESLEDKVYAD